MASQDTQPKVEEITETTKPEETEEEMPSLENQPKQERKMNKAEKKCVKALNKMGMKAQGGITRVTLKRRDGIVFVINLPEVYKSPTSENSFVVVGELKMDEPRIDNLPTMPQKPAPTGAPAEGEKETKEAAKTEDKPAESKEEEKKATKAKDTADDDDDEEIDESGISPVHIDMVMNNGNCTRKEAVKALIASNNDMVNAIMYLTKQQ